MSRIEPKSEPLSREALIARLREKLIEAAGDDSVCRMAAERGIYCKGFCRYDDAELRERYSWIDDRRPGLTREDLERIANDWQLAQQEVFDLPTACDVQAKVHDTCRGWQDFTTEQLAAFYEELIRTTKPA
jgi:uncharacterized protein YbjT (DUF2867 family)